MNKYLISMEADIFNSPKDAEEVSLYQPIAENSSRSRKIVTFALARAFSSLNLATAISQSLFGELRFISSKSMLPTLEVGDRVIVEKISYLFRNPNIHDIVLFRPPPTLQAHGYHSNDIFVKRVIAKAGDTVEVKDGKVFVNSVARKEDFVNPMMYTMSAQRIQKGCVFVLGDNRNHSNDSHIWGALPVKNILGRSVFRYWPPEQAGSTV
ncbi:hypothetical protein KP509_13G077000 [Ceratopteris richardii]|uniref:signal peptidase I n=1 Tax=Ceratopteris richardii TaxID=49495 RepID=A0A8T2TK52_CERRI|nr:hypothetical protein KP509_13G077000 [Ceratopteris richardii]